MHYVDRWIWASRICLHTFLDWRVGSEGWGCELAAVVSRFHVLLTDVQNLTEL